MSDPLPFFPEPVPVVAANVLSLAAPKIDTGPRCDLTRTAAAVDLIDVKLERADERLDSREWSRSSWWATERRREAKADEARVLLTAADRLYDAIKFRDESILRPNIKYPSVNNVHPSMAIDTPMFDYGFA